MPSEFCATNGPGVAETRTNPVELEEAGCPAVDMSDVIVYAFSVLADALLCSLPVLTIDVTRVKAELCQAMNF